MLRENPHRRGVKLQHLSPGRGSAGPLAPTLFPGAEPASPSSQHAVVGLGQGHCSVAKLCPTLQPHGLQLAQPPCPSQSLPKFMSIESVCQ